MDRRAREGVNETVRLWKRQSERQAGLVHDWSTAKRGIARFTYETVGGRAGFEPVSKTGFPLKRGAKSALEAAQIRLFATRFATIDAASI